MATDPLASQADIDASIVENTTGLVTPTILHRILTGINSALVSLVVVVGGVAYLNPAAIPAGSITSDKLAPGVIGGTALPSRVATGAAAVATLPADYLVVLNGPSEVDLEKSPPINTTHVIKQANASMSPVNVVAAAGDTIDGAQNLLFPPSATHPALALQYTLLGWQAY